MYSDMKSCTKKTISERDGFLTRRERGTNLRDGVDLVRKGCQKRNKVNTALCSSQDHLATHNHS